jgi:[protein-PII] uridylyltransferase
VAVSDISVSAFAASLPSEYRSRFNPAQIAIHAHTSIGRGQRAVAATLFPWPDPGLSALCVVANDRPGLLSLISAALNELGFDVDSAEAFTRAPQAEAVDVFWLRDPDGHVGAAEVEAFVRLVEEILAGRPERTLPQPTPVPAAHSGQGTTVRFLEDESGALTVLEVETDDRSGLLWTITRALYRQNVQIVGSKIRTEASRVYDRFTIVELDGSLISGERRLTIQVEVMSAVAHPH